MDDILRIVEMFRKRVGWKLTQVSTQSASTTLLATELDRPTHQAEQRIVLDFVDDVANKINSIIIHISVGDEGPTVLGFEENND